MRPRSIISWWTQTCAIGRVNGKTMPRYSNAKHQATIWSRVTPETRAAILFLKVINKITLVYFVHIFIPVQSSGLTYLTGLTEWRRCSRLCIDVAEKLINACLNSEKFSNRRPLQIPSSVARKFFSCFVSDYENQKSFRNNFNNEYMLIRFNFCKGKRKEKNQKLTHNF